METQLIKTFARKPIYLVTKLSPMQSLLSFPDWDKKPHAFCHPQERNSITGEPLPGVYINSLMLSESKRTFKAIIWHEIGHLRHKDIDGDKYVRDKNYKTECELRADMMSAKMGYATEMITHLQEMLSFSLTKRPSAYYLSQMNERIKALLAYTLNK